MIKSLQLSQTKYDIVVLVSEDVNLQIKKVLHEEGVNIIDVPYIQNFYTNDKVFQKKFQNVMAKLNLWNLTQYEKVVYLDADTLVFENSDELFQCEDFCAVFINPCIFNSGVMVLKPSQQIYEDMLQHLQDLPSYDGADQGFLNSYFSVND